MMRWIYLLASLGFALKMLTLTPTAPLDQDWSNIAALVAEQGGVPNAVAAIIFRNRLYDTIFEVIVFTIAIAGVKHLLADETPQKQIHLFPDRASAIMARLGATITTLVAVELAIRGHLSPGGGFAAGVAGGTAIGLIAMTSAPAIMEEIYRRWRAAAWEKLSVLAFLALAALALMGITPPTGEMGALFSGGFIPWFNLLVAIKVALGSWAAVLLFIRYRGLL